MSIFQKSVINKYLKTLDDEKLKKARQQFDEFYGNKLRLLNIMQLKEENYQEGFLREIFVDVLGYTINPNTDFNLTTEYKNQTGAKKVDGAILKEGKATGVIELKSTKTKDLDKVTEQAFNYKNNQPGCRYVITSNFQKLRFYIDNATEYEEFNLFNLTDTDFKIFYLLLNKDALLNDLPAKLKDETKFHEEDISKQFYKDYQNFKYSIFNNLVKNNPDYDKLILFKKSQKLLDRFLFVFFAEDTGLIPPNAVTKIVEQWKQLQELEAYQPLYDRFKLFFSHLNTGHKYKEFELPPYNGGLFAHDELLDNVKIDDEVLKDDSLHMSAYDFNTDVDVNILGHIFEHSLNEIEEITAELEGEKANKKTSKRKKDGVFYTPKYITKYIVENTIGTLCKEKKEELALIEFDAADGYRKADGKLTAKAKKLFDTLEKYRKWLMTLKVLDPACGSGAFLNQALSFFMEEHNWIAERQQEITGDASTIFTDTDKAVLENNIYGVDINEESVEIAKLSLWLRTAQKGRTLSDLSGNIKCGNSLIYDSEVAGEKAFDWNTEFKEIMDKGGFDVVIGNPPYVPGKSLSSIDKDFFKKNYQLLTGKYDLYILFIIKVLILTSPRNIFSFIIPNSVLVNENATLVRKKLINDKLLNKIRVFKDDVFPDANVESVVICCSESLKKKSIDLYDYMGDAVGITEYNTISKDKFYRIQMHLSDTDIDLITKIDKKSIKLNDISDMCIGIQIGGAGNSKDFKEKYISYNKNNETFKKVIDGKDFEPFQINWNDKYISYGNWLHRKRDEKYFLNPKIIVRQIGSTPVATIDIDQFYTLNTIYNIIIEDDNYNINYVYILLNSKLIKYYWSRLYSDNKSLFPKIKKSQLIEIPICKISKEGQTPFILIAGKMLSLNKSLQKERIKFYKRIKSNFEVEKISGKLQNFYKYDFKTFLAELKKQKIKLSLSQQDEWEEYFDTYKQEINQVQNQISQTDKQIDQMVYELYELTEEEIQIVERN